METPRCRPHLEFLDPATVVPAEQPSPSAAALPPALAHLSHLRCNSRASNRGGSPLSRMATPCDAIALSAPSSAPCSPIPTRFNALQWTVAKVDIGLLQDPNVAPPLQLQVIEGLEGTSGPVWQLSQTSAALNIAPTPLGCPVELVIIGQGRESPLFTAKAVCAAAGASFQLQFPQPYADLAALHLAQAQATIGLFLAGETNASFIQSCRLSYTGPNTMTTPGAVAPVSTIGATVAPLPRPVRHLTIAPVCLQENTVTQDVGATTPAAADAVDIPMTQDEDNDLAAVDDLSNALAATTTLDHQRAPKRSRVAYGEAATVEDGLMSPGFAAIRRNVTAPQPCCLEQQRAREFMATLNLSPALMDMGGDRCFCMSCYGHSRPLVKMSGCPAAKHTVADGWVRFGVALQPRAKGMDVLNTWHKAYHGTSKDNVASILWSGGLVIPGTAPHGGDMAANIQAGHITKPIMRTVVDGGVTKQYPFDPQQIFASPSIKYVAHGDVYCKKSRFITRMGQVCHAYVAFELRARPGSYTVGPQTVTRELNMSTPIDPEFSNAQLEWSSKEPTAFVITGLLVKVVPAMARQVPIIVPQPLQAVQPVAMSALVAKPAVCTAPIAPVSTAAQAVAATPKGRRKTTKTAPAPPATVAVASS